MFHYCVVTSVGLLALLFLNSSNCEVMSEMASSITMSSLGAVGRTPFVAAFELLSGALRTRFLVVVGTVVADLRAVVSRRSVVEEGRTVETYVVMDEGTAVKVAVFSVVVLGRAVVDEK